MKVSYNRVLSSIQRYNLSSNVDIGCMFNVKYNESQLWALHYRISVRKDANEGVAEVERFTNGVTYTGAQLSTLFEGIDDGVDVTPIANPKLRNNKMVVLLRLLLKGVDVSKFNDPKLDSTQMVVLGQPQAIELELYKYAHRYNAKQLKAIINLHNRGIDILDENGELNKPTDEINELLVTVGRYGRTPPIF